MKKKSPAAQLDAFFAKYTPAIAEQGKAALAKMRKRLPGAVEMVYDNYNALVIGFGPTEKPSQALFSIVLFPRWVTLCFIQGAKLHDPHRRLKGGGKQVRTLRLDSPDTLDESAVQGLIAAALEQSPEPIDATQPARLIIKSISANQRPRRPGKK